MALPSLPGGTASKVADLYEAVWTVDRLLDLLAGDITEIHLEPQGPDGLGVEFYTVLPSGAREYHSVKRQAPTSSSAWTAYQLTRTTPTPGRSILGDLFRHLDRGPDDRAVFVSQDSARDVRELVERSKSASSSQEFHRSLSGKLQAEFDKHVEPLPRSAGDPYLKLQRCEFETVTHRGLVRFVEQRIPALIQRADGGPADPGQVRLLLSEFAWNRLGQTTTADDVVSELQGHGFAQQPLAASARVQASIDDRNEAYIRRITRSLINSSHIPRSQATTVAEELMVGEQSLLLAGSAGEGKSCLVAQVIKKLRAARVPHVALSMDELEGIVSSAGLGDRMGLPASPAIVLGQLSAGSRAVLCIDQLDALSLVSGRNVQGRELLEELLSQASRYPEVRILLACRAFDLEHDAAFLGLVGGESPLARRVEIEKLSAEDVRAALATAGVDDSGLGASQVELLRTPLHLYLFLGGGVDREGFGSRRDLFGRYWDAKRRWVDERTTAGAFTAAVARVADVLSTRRQLQAPLLALTGHEAALDAMASEGVIVRDGDRVAFFHASFFDYAFARGFIGQDEDLVDWLKETGQDLFRRSQTRQVLEFLRADDPDEIYVDTLKRLLGDRSVRFHLKRLALDWLGQLSDPREAEWQVLEALNEQFQPHALGAIRNSVHWFDLLNRLGVVREWLTSGREPARNRAISLIRMPNVLRDRSSSAAGLLQTLHDGSEENGNRLAAVMSFDAARHSREMMDLFLELADAGTLDILSGPGTNRDWWLILYTMSTEKPDYCAEAIGHWLDRQRELAARRQNRDRSTDPNSAEWHSDFSKHVISSSASGAPLAFARQLLPRVLRAAGGVDSAPWEHRFGLSGEIVEALLDALRRLGSEHADCLDDLVASLPDERSLLIDTLIMTAWTNNPDRYADRILALLIDRQELLGQPGAGPAVSAATRLGDPGLSARLEDTILQYAPEGERGWLYGRSQYRLLTGCETDVLSDDGARRLEELRRKFGDEPPHDQALVPKVEFGEVPPRIPPDATARMSDANWLHAMRTLRRAGTRGSEDLDWDQVELSRQLEARTKVEPERFARLAVDRMDDNLPPLYFPAILDGLASKDHDRLPHDEIILVIRRLHELPGRPCGLSVVRAAGAIAKEEVPSDVIEAVAFYAREDPDPEEDRWLADPGDMGVGKRAVNAAINSVRGEAARAIADLLFADANRIASLRGAVAALVRDRTLAVRSVASLPLLAILRSDERWSLELFTVLCAGADPVLGSAFFERYLHYAAYRSYDAVRPILLRMLASQEAEVRRTAARRICLAALHDGPSREAASEDAARVEAGDSETRIGAAEVYAQNCGHPDVAAQCLEKLPRFFDDPADEVRRESARCFDKIEADELREPGALIDAFSTSEAFADGPFPLLNRLEDMRGPLPSSVCSLVDRAVGTWGAAAGDIQTSASLHASILAKLIVRLYAQASDDGQRKRALDAIDRMLEAGFYGLDDELEAVDRA